MQILEWIRFGLGVALLLVGLGTFLLPVRPRRCDHFEVRLQGEGDVCLYSFARVFEKGSDRA